MKHLINNQTNFISFLNKGHDFSDATNLGVRKIGSELKQSFPILGQVDDCFVTTFEVALAVDVIQNGSVLLNVLDSVGNSQGESIATVSGYDEDKPSAYIVLDNNLE